MISSSSRRANLRWFWMVLVSNRLLSVEPKVREEVHELLEQVRDTFNLVAQKTITKQRDEDDEELGGA